MTDEIDEDTTVRIGPPPPASEPTPPPQPPAPAAVQAQSRTVTVSRPIAALSLVGAFAIGALLVGGIAAGATLATAASTPKVKPTPTFSAKSAIYTALSQCDLSDGATGITVSDQDQTLNLDGAPEDSIAEGLQPDAEICVLQKLGATTAIITNMEGTRALDGTQTGSWSHFSASWRYHPDDGLDVIVTATK